MDIEKEREAFEAHCESIGLGVVTQKVAGIFANSIIRTTWSGWLSCAESKQFEIDNLKTQLEQAKAQAVPDGFVLVPREPTQKMLDATINLAIPAVYMDSISGQRKLEATAYYKAMINKAQEQDNE